MNSHLLAEIEQDLDLLQLTRSQKAHLKAMRNWLIRFKAPQHSDQLETVRGYLEA